ncbi:MAG TPA: cobalt ECF transporter T component CbiQ [Microcoleaceae cyanobacterium]|jgi:cobalt/nickel transport system permease protein
MLLHIGAFRLDVDSHRGSLWHQLAPQTRLLSTLLLVFAIALTPHGRWLTWAIYGVGVGTIVLMSRVTLLTLLQRVSVELIFIGLVLINTLFRDTGTVLWQWGWLQITDEGVIVLGSVLLKAVLSLLMLNTLVMTTAVPALLHALSTLRTPPLLVAILEAMYRYINVLVEEFQAMRRAAISRNLLNSNHWYRLVIANMIGSLFIRTYERGDRIHQAMLARGYNGQPAVNEVPKSGYKDRMTLVLVGLLMLVGQAIYVIS